MERIKFQSFETTCTGRLVSSHGDTGVVFARNPHGTHNLVLVTFGQDNNAAFRHGNAAVLTFLANWAPEKLFRKARSFLALRGHESRSWTFPQRGKEICPFCGQEVFYTSCGLSPRCNNGYAPDCPTAIEADSLDCMNVHGEPCIEMQGHCGCTDQ